MKGSSFTRPSTDHDEPLILLGVGGETNFTSVTWERGTLGEETNC